MEVKTIKIADIAPSHGPVENSWKRALGRVDLHGLDDMCAILAVVPTARLGKKMPKYMIFDGHHRLAAFYLKTGLGEARVSMFRPTDHVYLDYPKYRRACLEWGVATLDDFIEQAQKGKWWTEF